MSSKIIFMSHVLDGNTPSYGDRDELTISVKSEIKNMEGANTSSINFSNNHIGTHMDSPFHFCSDGKKTTDYPAEEFFYRNVAVVNFPCIEATLITFDDLDLDVVDPKIEFLFINTHYEKYRETAKYHNDNPGLDASLADALRKHFPFLRAIGIDSISLTSWKYRPEGRIGHRAFLCGERPLIVVEDVSFSELGNRKVEWMVMSPLRTIDGNGGPVTIISKVI